MRKIRVAKRDNVIVNRLNKTKEEKQVDFREEREKRDQREREHKKRVFKQMEEERKEEERRRKEDADKRCEEDGIDKAAGDSMGFFLLPGATRI